MTLRLATYNLKDYFEPRSDAERPIVEQKIKNVAAMLRRANADVVAFQEVGAPGLLERLCRGELADLGYGFVHVGPPDKRGIGNAIASRPPVIEKSLIMAESLAFPRFSIGDPPPYEGVPLRRADVHAAVDAAPLGRVDVLTMDLK